MADGRVISELGMVQGTGNLLLDYLTRQTNRREKQKKTNIPKPDITPWSFTHCAEVRALSTNTTHISSTLHTFINTHQHAFS
jgi:hypothetical protein